MPCTLAVVRCKDSMNILSVTNFDPCNIDVTQIFDGDFEQDADALNIAVPPKSITSS